METPIFDKLALERGTPQLRYPPHPPISAALKRQISKAQNEIMRAVEREVTNEGLATATG